MIDNIAHRVTLTHALMEKNNFGHWCVKNIKSHEKLMRVKVVAFEIFFQKKGLTQLFMREVLYM